MNLAGFTYVNKIRSDVCTACVNVKKVKRCSTFYIYVRGSHIASNLAVHETGTNSVRYNFRDNCFCLHEGGLKNYLMPVSLIPVAEPSGHE